MEIKVLFFGVLSEVAGAANKHYSEVKSFGHLKMKIKNDYPEFVHYNYLISINNEFINNYPVLKEDDEVALMPPFAGG